VFKKQVKVQGKEMRFICVLDPRGCELSPMSQSLGNFNLVPGFPEDLKDE
jgi:hypothetical protein